MGDASKWKELGYTGDPTKLQIGEKIDITKFRSDKSSKTEPEPKVKTVNVHKDTDAEEEKESEKDDTVEEQKSGNPDDIVLTDEEKNLV